MYQNWDANVQFQNVKKVMSSYQYLVYQAYNDHIMEAQSMFICYLGSERTNQPAADKARGKAVFMSLTHRTRSPGITSKE